MIPSCCAVSQSRILDELPARIGTKYFRSQKTIRMSWIALCRQRDVSTSSLLTIELVYKDFTIGRCIFSPPQIIKCYHSYNHQGSIQHHATQLTDYSARQSWLHRSCAMRRDIY